MKILVVDDDENKIQTIVSYLNEAVSYETAHSYRGAMDKLFNSDFDAVILDMGFPSWDNGEGFQPDQGLNVLFMMEQQEDFPPPVLVVSGEPRDEASEFPFVTEIVRFDPGISLRPSIERLLSRIERH